MSEHLSPKVDAESGIDGRCLCRGFCCLFPSLWRRRRRRRSRRLVRRLLGNRNPPNVSPFGGRLRRRWWQRLDGRRGGLNGRRRIDWFFLAFPYVLARELRAPRFPPGARLPFSPSALAATVRLASRRFRPLPFCFLKFATKILQRPWTDGKDCCPVAAL